MNRVLLISPSPPPYGGIANWTRLIKGYSARIGFNSIDYFDSSIKSRNIFDLSVFGRLFRPIPEYLRQFVRLFRLMYSGVYSTVHIATSGQFSLVRDIYVLLLAKIFKIKSVIHMRIGSLPTVVSGHSLYSFAVSIAVKLASVVIVIDKRTLMALSRRCPGARIEYIPNCIDISDIENYRFLKEKVVLFVGWVIKSKGVEELLQAWMIARRDGWNLNVVGPLDSEYMSLLKESYGLDKVSFSGELPHKDVLRLMESSSIFVLPSHTEGFPNVLLEAMSSQCAVVATDVGAIPEMLSDGCGLLIKVGDVDSLSESLSRLMNDDDFRLELAVNARKRVDERYDIQQIFSKYQSIWMN